MRHGVKKLGPCSAGKNKKKAATRLLRVVLSDLEIVSERFATSHNISKTGLVPEDQEKRVKVDENNLE